MIFFSPEAALFFLFNWRLCFLFTEIRRSISGLLGKPGLEKPEKNTIDLDTVSREELRAMTMSEISLYKSPDS